MPFKPWRPQAFTGRAQKTDTDFKAVDEDVIRTLAEIEKASTPLPSATSNTPIGPGRPGVQPPRAAMPRTPSVSVRVLVAAIGAAVGLSILGLNLAVRHILPPSHGRSSRVITRSAVDPALQAEAEQLLQKVASGDAGAADEVLARSRSWTSKTHRSSSATQWITAALHLPDLHAREAAIQAEVALDGVTPDESGLGMLEKAVGNPSQRTWALWTLGALGNRGVDPAHATKVIGAYLSDPQLEVRAWAVTGLALVGTDETIPMLLDRFRNDPSPVVQERAACALAEAGMYTHEQRMLAAASLVSWLDDSSISAPQRVWTLHALRDISGQNLGTGSAAWRAWYEGAR